MKTATISRRQLVLVSVGFLLAIVLWFAAEISLFEYLKRIDNEFLDVLCMISGLVCIALGGRLYLSKGDKHPLLFLILEIMGLMLFVAALRYSLL
jgi:hypothetical protein